GTSSSSSGGAENLVAIRAGQSGTRPVVEHHRAFRIFQGDEEPVPHGIRMLYAIAVGALTPGTATANRTAADTTLKKETLGSGIYLFRAPSDLDKWTATNVVVVI